MKLAAISDLHHPESGVDLPALAAEIASSGAEALVLAGDAVSQYHPPLLSEVLTTLAPSAPVRAYVPGNHELWSKEGSTAHIYERHLPALCEKTGWHYLDAAPLLLGDVALVGNVGWYDHSLTDRSTFPDFRVAFGEAMLAAARGRPAESVRVAEVTDAQLAEQRMVIFPDEQMAAAGLKPALLRWNDRRFVRLGVPDAAFAQDCARRLRDHLRHASDKAGRIVVVTHTAAFSEALAPPAHPVAALTRAYLGAAVLGESIMECPKVVAAISGHQHRPGERRAGTLPVHNVTARPDRGGRVVFLDV